MVWEGEGRRGRGEEEEGMLLDANWFVTVSLSAFIKVFVHQTLSWMCVCCGIS